MSFDADLPDWSLIRSFLAVAETGSLTTGARATGQSQPTLSRHIRALEARLGVELFRRHPLGLALTPVGQELLAPARRMQVSLRDLALGAKAQSPTISGEVRIAASVFVAHHLLPQIMARIAQDTPDLTLVLMPSDESENLAFRGADIAVRMYRPHQLDLVARHLGDIEIGIFAARSYLERAGRPRAMADLMGHAIVDYDRNPLIRQGMAAQGWRPEEARFALRSDNQSAYWELVRAGGGIGFCLRPVARADPLVEELDLGAHIPPLPVWLTAQDKVRRIPRIDHVWRALADSLTGFLRPSRQIDRDAPSG